MDMHEVLGRMIAAGRTLKRLPGPGADPAQAGPSPVEIDHMDEVVGEWMFLLRTPDERRLFAWTVSGLSLERAAAKDPLGRSPQAIRRAVGRMAADLAARLGR